MTGFNQRFDQHGAWRRDMGLRLKAFTDWLREQELLDDGVFWKNGPAGVIGLEYAGMFAALGVPEGRFEIAALVPVGRPAGRFGVAPRKPVEAVTHWNRYGERRR